MDTARFSATELTSVYPAANAILNFQIRYISPRRSVCKTK